MTIDCCSGRDIQERGLAPDFTTIRVNSDARTVLGTTTDIEQEAEFVTATVSNTAAVVSIIWLRIRSHQRESSGAGPKQA